MSRNQLDDSPRLDKTGHYKRSRPARKCLSTLKEIVMKTSFATAALIIVSTLSAGSSFAAYSAPQNRLNTHDTSSYFAQSAASVLNRNAVKGDVISARQAIAGVNTHDTSSHFPKATPSVLSRAEVKADAVKAQRSGNASSVDYRG